MSIDEGYVKYDSVFSEGPPPDADRVAALNRWRKPLRDAGLVGHDERHDVGFGNLSVRVDDVRFVISGTQTGHIARTGGQHYALVTDVDIDANRVSCTGPVQASSEALTHAALYALDDAIGAVVHVHSAAMWAALRGQWPTTRADVPYGTPAMAREFERLWQETDFSSRRLAVMAGHEDGIVSIGADLGEAAERVLSLQS